MRVEFRYWPGNTEVCLIEDIGDWPRVKRSFYTATTQVAVAGSPWTGKAAPFNAEFYYDLLYEMAPLPIIGGQFSEFNPYWAEHPEQARRAKMERDGVTKQDLHESRPPRQGEPI